MEAAILKSVVPTRRPYSIDCIPPNFFVRSALAGLSDGALEQVWQTITVFADQ